MSLRKAVLRKNRKEKKKSLPDDPDFFITLQADTQRQEAPRHICRGAFTLEAAVIMPLLATLFVFFLFYFRIMQIQLVVQDALDTTARDLAVYAGVVEEEKSIDYFVKAKSLVILKLAEDEKIKRYVSGDVFGIGLSESEFLGDYVFLKANYQMKFPVNLLGKKVFYIHQQACYRKWTGWHQSENNGAEDCYVYITETGSVYHKTLSCKYLDLSIHGVLESEVPKIRNESGQKYQKCNICAEKNNINTKLYITDYGTCYHYDLNCSGLKRTIYKVHLSEVEGKGKCSKCWN